jgi:hypothetical protein
MSTEIPLVIFQKILKKLPGLEMLYVICLEMKRFLETEEEALLHEIGLIFQSKLHIYMCVWNNLYGQSLHDWDHEMWIFFVTGE